MTVRQFAAAIALTCLISISAFAGDLSSPPCAPGDLSSPPCQVALQAPEEASDTNVLGTPSTVVFSTIAEGVLKEMLAIW